ncbi:DNA topoisomerase IV subunit A [Clostridium bornimense]|uniref:DNA topoisomerase IV subunit A n=1 Tax=Clostridium bornimense TaxID=1216932 RepID=UPI001C114DC3|nr:DNA topoisomerase IV subunit A [Clostridium bornimense]MBU5314696.1 DNA topoisomerase IV subunit A [Clostridium bornimense]
MAKKINIPTDKNVIRVPIEEAMPDNYLPYAVEVAKERALPDVRDGLKPVHRRILYGAYRLKAFPDKPYYKSARIVGDILGKYHPHGDSSVYDAMVILAQNFSTKEPLIDGHGNWGSIDGDSAAAMRYTEARLSSIALEMLRDIEKDTVDMVDNYSGSELEPSVLPSRYPNILVNGSFGIAVGLSTNIPPHNLGEVIDGILAYIDNEEITTKELMNYIKGPDLPTGGELIGSDSILSAYETGTGKVVLRAKTSVEKNENNRWCIVITEFPYRKNKAKLLQTISEMTGDKKHSKILDGIMDIRDESDRTGIRAVIEFKKSVDEEGAKRVLKYLYMKTELQCNLPFNMVAIADGKPQTLSLKSILKHYINHQKEIITRRTAKELKEAEKRHHIVEGFIKAIGIMDEVIKTIRESTSKANARENLMNKFQFSELQSDAILELMLYRLTGLEIKAFEKEYKELSKLIKRLRRILNDDKELLAVVKKELEEVKDNYFTERKTKILDGVEDTKFDMEDIIVSEDVVITLSNEGYIKRISKKSFNRLSSGVEDIEYREGDFNRFLLQANTKDNIMIFTDKGNMYQTKVNNIKEMKWKEKGEKISEIIKSCTLDDESIVYATTIGQENINNDFVFITSKGFYKKTSVDKFITAYSKIAALKLKNDETLVMVDTISKDNESRFLNITLRSALNFIVEEPETQDGERMAATSKFVYLPNKDEIMAAEIVNEGVYAEFSLDINKKGIIKKKNSGKKITSNDDILLFTSKGSVLKVSAALFENLEENYDLTKYYEGFLKNDEIIKVVYTNDYQGIVVFSTELGYIKKTRLEEFKKDEGITLGYKLKTADDKLVRVEVIEDDIDYIMVTKKGMALRINTSSVSEMGKVASGVIAISLRDEDKVIYCNVINKEYDIKMISKNKEEKVINTKELNTQNRATRGKSVFTVGMDDYVNKIN